MPLYSFRLDVPASPDVVAERLRAIVREHPAFWEVLRSSRIRTSPSEPPFLGSVKGNSFHLCRNTNYQNSFLPRIHGRIDSIQNGARVKVVMFMHPLVLLFTLFWLGFVSYGNWRGLENWASSFIPLVMIIFGLSVSMGGFFSEAVKAKHWLSAALMNSAINTVPQQVAPLTDASLLQPEKSYSRFLRVAVAVCLLFLLNSVLKQYTNRLRDCPAFATSVAIVSKAHVATAALGEPIQIGSFVRGIVHQTAESGYALLSIPVHGPKAKGMVYVVANRFQDRWDLERVTLWTVAESKRLDLSPPTQREAFRYPASGKVYLVPFDNAAASDLRDVPAYMAERLGLEVTVMPVLVPGPETVDEATKQVIAERAIKFIAQTNQQIVDNLDSVAVGVTSQDLNIRSAGWTFATAYRRGRFGVLSTARLHSTPWYAGHNPEVFSVRVRKMVTRNVALLRYPVSLSADPTSALAAGMSTSSDVDEMGENFIGERGTWVPSGSGDAPCVTILQGPGGRQSWLLGCLGDLPEDSRFETFENDTSLPLFFMSRTDFALGTRPSLPFLRMYRSAEDHVQTFGIGTSDSFTIFPAGDSQTFSYIDLILAAGERIRFDRVSRGTGFADAKRRARGYMGSPFSQATLEWNSNGWDLVTRDGWTYRFPASGPDRSVRESALLRIEAGSGKVFSIQRTPEGDLQRAQAPNGSWIEFTSDSMHRISLAKNNSGRAVGYEYDQAGRLTHLRDSENGDEFYQYDPINRLTTVLDAKRRSLLQNTYGYMGEITSQTLADGRKLLYEYGWDENHKPSYLKFTDPNGYIVQWWQTRNGFLWSLPELQKSKVK